MRILVSLGTDVHPFERLLGWAERWASAHPGDTVVVQYGTTRCPVGPTEYAEVFPRDEMRRQFEQADAVVVSCGPGGVMDARASGRFPIVVARRAELGEHVDDHQRSFARHLASTGLAVHVATERELGEALEDARTAPERWRVEPSSEAPAGIARIGELIDELVWGD